MKVGGRREVTGELTVDVSVTQPAFISSPRPLLLPDSPRAQVTFTTTLSLLLHNHLHTTERGREAGGRVLANNSKQKKKGRAPAITEAAIENENEKVKGKTNDLCFNCLLFIITIFGPLMMRFTLFDLFEPARAHTKKKDTHTH